MKSATKNNGTLVKGMSAIAIATILAWPVEPAQAITNNELPFKATRLTIELTDNDIELQAFIDGNTFRSQTPMSRGFSSWGT